MSVCKTKCMKLINMWAEQNKRTAYFNVKKTLHALCISLHVFGVTFFIWAFRVMQFHSATKMSSQSMMVLYVS